MDGGRGVKAQLAAQLEAGGEFARVWVDLQRGENVRGAGLTGCRFMQDEVLGALYLVPRW